MFVAKGSDVWGVGTMLMIVATFATQRIDGFMLRNWEYITIKIVFNEFVATLCRLNDCQPIRFKKPPIC